ncbi:hypothetical protein LUZ61_015422 [Rhynchospora tenuis]|uniref:Uncharacterized protein n=1 Tax=Rhynchospora tenuis TaxID=198213 RepID=A0AAD5Z2K9_9POAL|nr:hypothetical protein LUZ61_015422 [Rhynchospora tenuis]
MVKLSSARDFRIYGPGGASDKWEYINAGLFLFSGILLIGGFLAQFSSIAFHVKSGLALVLISLLLISLVNVHDWIAHLAGIDWRLGLAEYDQQLALVEIVLPMVNAVGCVLFFVAVLFFEIEDKSWAWFGLFGSILLFIGGLMNLVKVFKMQQMDRSGLERLRGGARERLHREREGQVPLLDDSDTESRRKPVRKPYKDVLVESSQA